MLKVNDVAEKLNVSNRTVIRWIEEKKLTAYQFGKEYRIDKEELERFIEKSKTN